MTRGWFRQRPRLEKPNPKGPQVPQANPEIVTWVGDTASPKSPFNHFSDLRSGRIRVRQACVDPAGSGSQLPKLQLAITPGRHANEKASRHDRPRQHGRRPLDGRSAAESVWQRTEHSPLPMERTYSRQPSPVLATKPAKEDSMRSPSTSTQHDILYYLQWCPQVQTVSGLVSRANHPITNVPATSGSL